MDIKQHFSLKTNSIKRTYFLHEQKLQTFSFNVHFELSYSSVVEYFQNSKFRPGIIIKKISKYFVLVLDKSIVFINFINLF